MAVQRSRGWCSGGWMVLALLVAGAGACDRTAVPGEEGQGAPAGQVAGLSQEDQLILASAKLGLPPATFTAADLPDPESAGARELQHFCTACHALPSPATHSATDWPAVLRRMWLRMGKLGGGLTVPVPETGDRIIILEYVMANALEVSTENLPDAPGRDRFEALCGQCHELPDPRQHSPADWLVVVRRMGSHMNDLLGQMLSAEDLQAVVQYLERVSS